MTPVFFADSDGKASLILKSGALLSKRIELSDSGRLIFSLVQIPRCLNSTRVPRLVRL
jgi:hypothetical protein